MPATARMIMMVEPTEKARWKAKAAEAGISTAEFLRRAASEGTEPRLPPAESELASVAIAEINGSIQRMIDRLDTVLNRPPPALNAKREREVREAATAEFEAAAERGYAARFRELTA